MPEYPTTGSTSSWTNTYTSSTYTNSATSYYQVFRGRSEPEFNLQTISKVFPTVINDNRFMMDRWRITHQRTTPMGSLHISDDVVCNSIGVEVQTEEIGPLMALSLNSFHALDKVCYRYIHENAPFYYKSKCELRQVEDILLNQANRQYFRNDNALGQYTCMCHPYMRVMLLNDTPVAVVDAAPIIRTFLGFQVNFVTVPWIPPDELLWMSPGSFSCFVFPSVSSRVTNEVVIRVAPHFNGYFDACRNDGTPKKMIFIIKFTDESALTNIGGSYRSYDWLQSTQRRNC